MQKLPTGLPPRAYRYRDLIDMGVPEPLATVASGYTLSTHRVDPKNGVKAPVGIFLTGDTVVEYVPPVIDLNAAEEMDLNSYEEVMAQTGSWRYRKLADSSMYVWPET